MKHSFGFLVSLILFLPVVGFAQQLTGDTGGLVPCSGRDCGTCQLITLSNRVIVFIIQIMIAGAVLLIAWAGFNLITSGGNQTAYNKAKDSLQYIIIGLIIILASWLIVDTVLKALLPSGETQFGPWNQIPAESCSSQVELDDLDEITQFGDTWARVSASGFNQTQRSEQEVQNLIQGASSLPAGSGLCAYASANGVNCAYMESLILNESSNCTNEISPAGAYGCGQLLIPTARSLYSGFDGLSDEEVKRILIEDDDLNLRLSSQYFGQLYQQAQAHNPNTALENAYAAYNGGGVIGSNCNRGAVCPSKDCPGKLQWECKINQGGYVETENYVKNNLNTVNKLNQYQEPTL